MATSGEWRGTRRLEIGRQPVEVARALRGEPGLVFFDSAGNFPQNHEPPVSVIAARPQELWRGELTDGTLRRELAAWQAGAGEGLVAGWIDYEGAFCFGVYEDFLVFDHVADAWWGRGDLAAGLRWEERTGPRPVLGEWHDSLPEGDFIKAVERAQDYIAAGDIYQVNVARRLSAACRGEGDLFPLYERLRERSPAPWAAYVAMEGREILSSSPELFLRVEGGVVETRPIKGTRPRYADEARDRASAADLQSSVKEAAELVMITDLERNDLGRVCEFGSVRVRDLLQLEKLAQVYHLVSTVEGRLRAGEGVGDLLEACFPGGSITGAPKKRACEIIAELEPEARGFYTGTVGFVRAGGGAQFNIGIRSLVREGGVLSYGVGAGIVADSVPVEEFAETEAKARGLRLALAAWEAGESGLGLVKEGKSV